MDTAITIPAGLKPADGRFGSGPSKIRPAAVAALAARATDYLGTSHRQPPVRAEVARLRRGLAEFFSPARTGTRSSSATAARTRSGTWPRSR